MSAESSFLLWDEPDCHELAGVRGVGFLDANERHASLPKAAGEGLHLGLAWHREHDGVGPLREVAGTRFAASMKNVCGLNAARQVGPHDHVMGQRGIDDDCGFSRMGRRAWARRCGPARRSSSTKPRLPKAVGAFALCSTHLPEPHPANAPALEPVVYAVRRLEFLSARLARAEVLVRLLFGVVGHDVPAALAAVSGVGHRSPNAARSAQSGVWLVLLATRGYLP